MKKILVICILLLSGCAQLHKAKSEQLEDGVHRLSTIGNVFASQDILQGKLNERAERICGGPNNYEYLNEVEITEFEQDAGSGGASVSGSYQVYSRLMRCTNGSAIQD